MKYAKYMLFWLLLAIIIAKTLAPVTVLAAPPNGVTMTGVQFVEGADAVDAVLSGPSEPCVSRVPAWHFSIAEAQHSRFAAKKMAADCREAFAGAIRDFTGGEKNMLMTYVVMIDSVIDAEFPALNSFPWSFAVISDSADFGVPHSKEHIVLTQWLLGEMIEWLDKKTSMLFVGMEILLHEKMRLLQGMNPGPFDRFYSDVWGFRKIDPLPANRQMRDNGLYFPLIPQNEWAIRVAPRSKQYIMPALLLHDVVAGNGSAAQRIAIPIDSTSKGFFPRRNRNMILDYKDLRLIQQYRKMFPQSEHGYHPAELSADLMAKFLVVKYLSGKYGTASTRTSNYSQISELIRVVGSAGY